MAKKKGSFFKVLLVGAAVAGACYYASKKKTDIPVDMDDDLDLDDDALDTEEKTEEKRDYVNLNFGDVEKKVQDVVYKVADTATKVASQVGTLASAAEEKVVEFFDDRKNSVEPADVVADEEDEDFPADAAPATDAPADAAPAEDTEKTE